MTQKVRQKRFVPGESLLYLGDPYKLRIMKNAEVLLVLHKVLILASEHQREARKELLIGTSKRREKRYPIGFGGTLTGLARRSGQ